MARGGRRGQGSGRGKSRTSFAQSGGRSNSWSDTKKGSGTIGGQGGSRGQGVKATGSMKSGSKYKVRGPGGDKGLATAKGASTPAQHGVKHGAPAALSGSPHPKTKGATNAPYPKVHSVPRGRGGSNG